MKFRQTYVHNSCSQDGKIMGSGDIPFKVETMPISTDHSMNDNRSMEEMINEGDEDGLKFISYQFGNHDRIPFGNVQRNFPYRN